METHQGTYSTIAENKRNNRYAEMAYRRLDLLASMAGYRGNDATYSEIADHWKTMLLMQFHDVLPGSSIDAVYNDTKTMYADLFAYADSKLRELIGSVFAPTDNADAVTVFNPNSFTASAYVRVDNAFADCTMTDGSTPVNVIPDGSGHSMMLVRDLPGFSTRVYRKTAEKAAAEGVTLTVQGKNIAVETPFFRFIVADDGTLRDFFDKREEVILSAEEGFNRFVTYKDGPEIEDAWNIDKAYKTRPVDMQWQNRLEIAEANAERSVIRLTKTNGRTVLTQDITVYASIARVDFFSHIDWQEKYKILQVSFPTTIISQQASYEIAYGLVKRNTHANTPNEKWKHEYAAHRFVDLSDDRRGTALLNDCKYGHNVIDNDMILTLFRSTDFPSHFYDMGEHDFAYAFLPHAGGLSANQVAEQGYLFNSPFVVFRGEASVPAPFTLAENGMIIDCVKPAEDGDGVIIRAYEPYGVSGKVTLSLDRPAKVCEVTPLEEPISEIGGCNSFGISYKPFEIRSFRIV